jgi:transposase-like protein
MTYSRRFLARGVARGDQAEGARGVQKGIKEDKESWTGFLKNLRGRGPRGTELFLTDKGQGLVESVGEIFPEARRRCCFAHGYRNVPRTVPTNPAINYAA